MTLQPEQRPFIRAAIGGLVFFSIVLGLQIAGPLLGEKIWRLCLAVAHFPLVIWFFATRPHIARIVRDGLLALDRKILFFYALAMCLSVYLCGTPLLRSIMFFIYGLPAFMILWPYALEKMRHGAYLTRVAYVFLVFTLFQVIAPGIYIPPFLDGIAGWTTRITERTPVTLQGIKLVRDDGVEQWLSNAYATPATFTNWMMRDTRETVGDKAMLWFFQVYKKHWDLAQQGKTPSQRYLGNFAYPGHNPYLKFNYRDFPPEKIARLIFVMEKYDQKTLKLKSRDIMGTYELSDEERH